MIYSIRNLRFGKTPGSSHRMPWYFIKTVVFFILLLVSFGVFLLIDRVFLDRNIISWRNICMVAEYSERRIAKEFPRVIGQEKPVLPTTTPHSISRKNQYCEPVSNLVLLKVHKCASSAFQNIILRYGDSHNLTFALPPKNNYLGHREKFSSDFLIPLPSVFSNEYNLICHHTRFDADNMAQTMPRNTIYITSLKEPSAMYESGYDFFALRKRYNATLEEFLDHPDLYYYNPQYINSRFAKNPMMFDLGLEITDFENQTSVTEKINEINQIFSLVMIVEQMDESLVLMKDLLCWNWTDVMSFKVNRRAESRVAKLTVPLRKKILKWNYADYQLYKHFVRVFEEKKKAYGIKRLQKDVERLRKVTDWFKTKCDLLREKNVDDEENVKTAVFKRSVEEIIDTVGHKVELSEVEDICAKMTRRELKYTDMMREKLWPNFKISEERR